MTGSKTSMQVAWRQHGTRPGAAIGPKVLLVNQRYLPYVEHGGTVANGEQIARGLSMRGYRVCTLTADLGALEARLEAAGMATSSTTGRINDQLSPGREAIIYLRSLLRYHVTTLSPGAASFALRQLRGFDLVHIFGLYSLLEPPLALGCRLWGIPYVAEPSGMGRAQQGSMRKKKAYLALVGRPLLANACRVIATADSERQMLVADGVDERRVSLRPNGVDLPQLTDLPARGAFRRELGLSAEAPLVLFIGRISRIKGLDLAVQALARLCHTVTLAVCGPDEADGHLVEVRRLAGALGLGRRVRFKPARYGIEKLQALVDADVLILSSHTENFGLIAAEALACATPAVVTDTCGIAAILSGRGGLVAERTADAFAAALNTVLFDAATRERLVVGTREVARELSWDAAIDRLETIYNEILARGR